MKDTQCPKCGYDTEDEYLDWLGMLIDTNIFTISNRKSWFDGEFYRHDWAVNCKCPECGTEFSFDDSDI